MRVRIITSQQLALYVMDGPDAAAGTAASSTSLAAARCAAALADEARFEQLLHELPCRSLRRKSLRRRWPCRSRSAMRGRGRSAAQMRAAAFSRAAWVLAATCTWSFWLQVAQSELRSVAHPASVRRAVRASRPLIDRGQSRAVCAAEPRASPWQPDSQCA